MVFDVWSILILVFIAQGLFTLTILLTGERRKAPWNRYLVVLILAILWLLAEFLCIRNRIEVPVDFFYGTRYGSWLVVGPLTWFFFKSITRSNWKFSPKSWLHFVPFVVLVLIVPIVSGQDLGMRQIHYGMLSIFDYRPKEVTPFEYLYGTIFYVQFVHMGVYLLLNFSMISRYKRQLKDEYSNRDKSTWLIIFNVLLLLSLLFSSGYLYLLFHSDLYSRTLDYIYVLPIGFFIYSVGYYLSGIRWLPVSAVETKYRGSSLSEEDKQRLITQLEKVMLEDKFFLQNNLRLKHLADALESSPNHVSQVINEHFHCSFFDYVNKYRVQEAKRLITNNGTGLNLLQIAFESGFNNKTSFVNAFKKFEGVTPSTFRKTHSSHQG